MPKVTKQGWLEQGKSEKKALDQATAQRDAQLYAVVKDFIGSKLIKLIEKVKKEIEHQTNYRYALGSEEPSIFASKTIYYNSDDHFPNDAIRFSVTYKNDRLQAIELLKTMKQHYMGPPPEYFLIEMDQDGVYLKINSPRTRFWLRSGHKTRIEPRKITKDDVYGWFKQISKD